MLFPCRRGGPDAGTASPSLPRLQAIHLDCVFTRPVKSLEPRAAAMVEHAVLLATDVLWSPASSLLAACRCIQLPQPHEESTPSRGDAAIEGDGIVLLWNSEQARMREGAKPWKQLGEEGGAVFTCVGWHPQRDVLAAGDAKGRVKVWVVEEEDDEELLPDRRFFELEVPSVAPPAGARVRVRSL